MNPPNFEHELIVRNLQLELTTWSRHLTPPAGTAITQQPIRATNRRGYQPDIAWYPIEQVVTQLEGRRSVSGFPALVVEVLSPSNRSHDLIRKRRDYERLGVQEYWVIDPIHRCVLRLFRSGEGDGFSDDNVAATATLTSSILPGFAVLVETLFEL